MLKWNHANVRQWWLRSQPLTSAYRDKRAFLRDSYVKISFEVWRELFRESCIGQGRLVVFEALGEDMLRTLWRSGLDPSVSAVVEGSELSLPRFLFLLRQPA